MKATAVGLDDQVEFGPEEVDAEAVDAVLRLRQREAGSPGDRQKEALEVAVGEDVGLAVEELAEPLQPAARRRHADHFAQRLGMDEVKLVGLIDGRFELARSKRCREVDERLRWWCRRDAVAVRSGSQNGATMEGDARTGSAGFGGHRDVDCG